MQTIRQLRERRGWTQLELAHRLQVTPVTVHNWERGRTEPRLAQFRQLARLFGVRMDAIAPVDQAARPAAPPRKETPDSA